MIRMLVIAALSLGFFSCADKTQNGLESKSLASHVNSIVDFRIADGTGGSSWNTEDTAVLVTIGQTLRIHNDDTSSPEVRKRLHTSGRPCGHGTRDIDPGNFYDCLVTSTYDYRSDSPLYNHHVGSAARFYIIATSDNSPRSSINILQQVFENYDCASCHEYVVDPTYYSNKENLELIYQLIVSGEMPAGGDPVTEEEIDALREWIDAQ